MSTIKATIALSTTTLFPTPANVNVSVTEQVSGSADFQTLTIPADSSTVIYGPSPSADPSNTVYLYAQGASTNSKSLDVYIKNSTNPSSSLIATLRPTDFMWVPLASYGSDLQVTVVNLDGANASKVNVFWGERS